MRQDTDYCLTLENANKLIAKYQDLIIGKPLSIFEPFNDYVIVTVEIQIRNDFKEGCHIVKVVAESENSNELQYFSLIKYLNENNIPLEYADFGIVPR